MPHDALEMVEYGDRPAVCILADSAAGCERARRAAERAGCRIARALAVASADPLPDPPIPGAAILVELDGSDPETAARMLDWLNLTLDRGCNGSVVSAPAGLIDLVAARATHPDIVHLCEPSEPEQADAFAAAASRPIARLHDVGREEASRLQELAEHLDRMNSILASFSDEANAPSDDSDTEITSEHISAILRARRLRDKFFDRHLNLFADPAWDMLLDLMAHRLAGQRVAVSSLCIAAHVPATTALRWIKLLTAHGLLVRVADPQDGRRVFIELSDYAAAQLSAYLKALRHYQALVV